MCAFSEDKMGGTEMKVVLPVPDIPIIIKHMAF